MHTRILKDRNYNKGLVNPVTGKLVGEHQWNEGMSLVEGYSEREREGGTEEGGEREGLRNEDMSLVER